MHADDDMPITLTRYAEISNVSMDTVRRRVRNGDIPAWSDKTVSARGKVTSLGAIRRVQEARSSKAEKAFMQKAKLS